MVIFLALLYYFLVVRNGKGGSYQNVNLTSSSFVDVNPSKIESRGGELVSAEKAQSVVVF